MNYSNLILLSVLSVGVCTSIYAQENTISESSDASSLEETAPAHPRSQIIKDLKNIKVKDLKINANAAQPDPVKDPLQSLNRPIYSFNDMLDRNFLRPVAVQYREKTPEDVRGSYRQFRKNLGEPWNAVNQLIQGRPGRAAKTLGRFTINTLTTLGLADPASRLGLPTEEENFGVTLGYYGVPSGPFLMLPFFGPSTLRDGFGLAVDAQARPQKYIMEDQDGLYWSSNMLQAVDTRAQYLDLDQTLQGDQYAMIRDLYLQRKAFQIAEKKGDSTDVSFIDDDSDDTPDEDQNP
ncbi:VacJ family lipoprotein [Acinetobacter sp. WU_MDCI_Abxe161]|uniref:MlaA family lipoprotein n=1 Tax=Acinetobacter sp. WU_MDCI_Abxe161 TaxID=2850074 RepID=UPI0021CD2281|nr:VacJ family lipoprotein [Acinetobacter sp. WU_MDCI_Abxe161]